MLDAVQRALRGRRRRHHSGPARHRSGRRSWVAWIAGPRLRGRQHRWIGGSPERLQRLSGPDGNHGRQLLLRRQQHAAGGSGSGPVRLREPDRQSEAAGGKGPHLDRRHRAELALARQPVGRQPSRIGRLVRHQDQRRHPAAGRRRGEGRLLRRWRSGCGRLSAGQPHPRQRPGGRDHGQVLQRVHHLDLGPRLRGGRRLELLRPRPLGRAGPVAGELAAVVPLQVRHPGQPRRRLQPDLPLGRHARTVAQRRRSGFVDEVQDEHDRHLHGGSAQPQPELAVHPAHA